VPTNESAIYVKVLLPLALANTYTYYVPETFIDQLAIGKRVEVQFGKTRIYTSIIIAIEKNLVLDYVPKAIQAVLDDEPIVFPQQIEFWKWMAQYYCCTNGEVMQAAIPAAFKLSSETSVLLNPSYQQQGANLNDNEFLVYEALSIQNELTVKEVQKILELKSTYRIIKSLIEKQVITVEEELRYKYKPRYETYVQINPDLTEEAINEAHKKLNKAPKQQQLFEFILAETFEGSSLKKKVLLKKAGASYAQLKALVAKNLLLENKQQVNRIDVDPNEKIITYQLNEQQTEAFKSIKDFFIQKKVVLLHGVTSSGKTQIYIELLKEVISEGGQVLYLLPEIALTTQIIRRLKGAVNCRTGVYHSRYNDSERIELWQKVKVAEIDMVVGARSALFLPFKNLQLIIVDEAHDSSFKQQEPSPRYNARDAAIQLAHLSEAKVLLGAATPSVESYRNAKAGKYGYVTLLNRFGGVQAPNIKLVNLKRSTKRKEMNGNFSKEMMEAIQTALEEKEQVILFQNRRGYAPALVCQSCFYIPKCVQCDVSLTYHKFQRQLICHQCSYRQNVIKQCPSCGDTDLKVRNFGTEKIEEDIELRFPNAKVARMDYDAVKRKNGHAKIINAFENHEIDVLVGTQMVTKGLDFENVQLVGIINADQLLGFPDFRAIERAYQLMVQVSGRAGRRKKQGTVLIQTYHPEHPVFQWVAENNYENFALNELAERKEFLYPPFVRMMNLQLKHKDRDIINKAAIQLCNAFKSQFGNRVIGPAIPIISYVRNFHIRNIAVKMKLGKNLTAQKEWIKNEIQNLKSEAPFKSVLIQIDIDPY